MKPFDSRRKDRFMRHDQVDVGSDVRKQYTPGNARIPKVGQDAPDEKSGRADLPKRKPTVTEIESWKVNPPAQP